MRRNLRWPWNPVTTAPAPEVAWVIPTSWCDRKMAEFCIITHHPVLRASTDSGLKVFWQCREANGKEMFGVSLALLLYT